MQTGNSSVWQRLKKREITCGQALQLLVDDAGTVNLSLLDKEVTDRFLREFPDRHQLPPLLPLLLWSNCYYVGSPVELSPEDINKVTNRLFADLKIVPISDKSYRTWYRTTTLDQQGHDHHTGLMFNPLTGEMEQEDISGVTEYQLSKADNQIGRIITIIAGALRNRASDVHLEPQLDGLRVRYRIDGVLRDITQLPLMVEGVNVSRAVTVALKVLSKMDIAESRRPQDNRLDQDELKSALTQYRQDLEARKSKEKHKEEVAKLSKALEDLKVAEALLQKLKLDMRVSTLPCINGEKTVLRLLPQENPFSTIDTLGFSPKTLPLFQGWLQQPQGMIILTGPTGSGKTSTLYTSLQAIATESVNVVTVEDPVEYVLPRITQTQVHEAAGMTFAAGLRSILRQDPDIIMVGEIRDHETAETAVRASLTGHLVLTTLHTNDAISAIPRLKDIGPDPGLLSDALLGIVAQRLVRRVCPHCAQPHHPTESELKVLDLDLRQAHPEAWRKGQGCARCLNSGYLGREAVMELLVMDDRVKQLIYEGSMSQVQSYLREESNFYPFRLAAIEKVTTGLTTVPELLRVLPQSAFSRRSDNGTYPTIARPIPAPLSHPSPQEGRGALSIT